jgi:hypothetical protein
LHDVVFSDVHVSVELWPAVMELGSAANETVGAAAGAVTVTVTEVFAIGAFSPIPTHVIVYVVVLVGLT